MADQQHHHVNYLGIFGALCVCTLASVGLDLIDLRHSMLLLIALVLGVAVIKALFVMAYFMHLKFEGKWKWVLLMPTTILAVGIPLAMLPDIGEHYYDYDVPQSATIAVDHGHGDDGGEHAEADSHDEAPAEPNH